MIELDLEPYCDNCPHFEAESNVSIFPSFFPSEGNSGHSTNRVDLRR